MLPQAFLDPKAKTVTVVSTLGELRVASVLPLATYLVRQMKWPGYYPDRPTIIRPSKP